MDVQLYLRGAGLAMAGAVFWLMYFDLKDRLRPEPRRRLLSAFGLGTVAAALAVAGFDLAGRIGLPKHPGTTTSAILVYSLALIGPIEEGCKFALARAVVWRWPEFDERVDGIVYASALAIGFAAAESVLYVPHLPLREQLARAFAAPLTHSVFAAGWGYGLARARLDPSPRGVAFAWQAGGLALASLVHGLYDFVILAHDASFLSSLIALLAWVAVIVMVRRSVPRHAVPRNESSTVEPVAPADAISSGR